MRSQATNITKQVHFSLLILLSLVLSACGGSKEFPTPEAISDTTAPNVDFFSPNAESSENFEVDSKVNIIFSELMNLDSLVVEGGIKLFKGSNDINSDVIPEEREYRIEFDTVPLIAEDIVSGQPRVIPATKAILSHQSGRFALNTEYFFSVDVPARDAIEDDILTSEDERNFIESETVVGFFTEKGDWKKNSNNNVIAFAVPNVAVTDDSVSPAVIEQQDFDQFSPRLLSNGKGDTFLVWRQASTLGTSQLWVTRYEANLKKWSLTKSTNSFCDSNRCANAELISSNATTSIIDFDAAINDEGKLAVVWTQAAFPGEFTSIWSRIFDGKNWQSNEIEISSTGVSNQKLGDADSAKVALDDVGNAVSVWRESDSQYSRIKSNTFDVLQRQWVEAPIFLDNNLQQNQLISQNPQIAMNGNGVAIAVWEQQSADVYQIFSNRLRLKQSEKWVGAERIDNIDNTNPEFGVGASSQPVIAIDENNDAIAIWLKYDGQRNNVWFNRFVGSWQAQANYLERNRLGDASFANVIIGKNNQALAYWVQEDKSTNVRSLYSSFFTTFVDWQSEELLASSDSLSKPNARFDREGNAIIVWQDSLVSSTISARYYSERNTTWSAKTDFKLGTDPQIAPLYEDGRFLAAWLNRDNRLETALFSD